MRLVSNLFKQRFLFFFQTALSLFLQFLLFEILMKIWQSHALFLFSQKFRACGLNQIVGAKWHKRQVVTSVCQELRRVGGGCLTRQKGSYLAFPTLCHSTQKDWRKTTVFKETTAYFSSPNRGCFTARPYFCSFLLIESLARYSYSAVRFFYVCLYTTERDILIRNISHHFRPES